jgi:hypothetical protein
MMMDGVTGGRLGDMYLSCLYLEDTCDDRALLLDKRASVFSGYTIL